MRYSFKLLLVFILIIKYNNIHAQCPVGKTQFIIDVVPFENWEFETSWDIKDISNNIIASGTYGKDTICYTSGAYFGLSVPVFSVAWVPLKR
ncbi:MAG: hypothetical protein RLZZ414_1451 [Bacteroidota bacterium]|jgi:hypothetical protein